jgi:hypothetical protein
MKLRSQFSIPQQTSDLEELKRPNPPSKQAKKKAKFRDKTYVANPNARI